MEDTKLGTTYVEIVAKVDKLEKDLKNVQSNGEKAASSVESSFKKISGALAGIGIAYSAMDIGKKIIETASAFEQLQTRLTSMYGDAKKASQVFNLLKQIASTTPFSLREVTEGAVTMKAFGMDVEENIKSMTDLAAFMGLSVPEAAAAMGRAFAGGVGAADILRERGILNLIKSFNGIDDLTKLTLPQFREVLMKTVKDPASGIAGATDNLSKTLKGAASNFGDAMDMLFNAIGSKINPSLGMLARMGTEIVSSLTPAENHFEQMQIETLNLRTRFDELSTTYLNLAAKTNKTDVEQQVYKETIVAIKKEFPEYFKNIDLQNAKMEEAKTAFDKASVSLNDYIENMIKLSIIEDKKGQIVSIGKRAYDTEKQLLEDQKRLATDKNLPQSSPKMFKDGNLPSASDYLSKDALGERIKANQVELDELDKQKKAIIDEIAAINKTVTDTAAPTSKPKVKNVTGQVTDPKKEKAIEKTKTDALKDYYDTVKWFDENYYEYRVNLISKEVEAFKKSGIDKQIDLAKYRNRKLIELDQERYEQQGKFLELLYQNMTNDLSSVALYQSLNYLKKGDTGQIELPGQTTNPPTSMEKRNEPKFEPFDTDKFDSDMDKVWEHQMQSVQILATNLHNAFDTAPDSFLGKLEQGVMIALQIANAIKSMNQPGGDGFSGILGLIGSIIPGAGLLGSLLRGHFGGTFVNNNGVLTRAPHFAKGVKDFIVPPGHPNDSFPMWVESKERVTVTPANQSSGGDMNAVVTMLSRVNGSIRAMNMNLINKNMSVSVINSAPDIDSRVKENLSTQNKIVRSGVNTNEL